MKDLRRSYGARTALDGVSFRVEPGEIFGLLGPNGSGKTTLFRVLSTLLPPSGGEARVAGRDTAREAAAVRAAIGVVFQSPGLDRKLTALENLVHQGHLYGLSGGPLRARCGELLRRVALSDRAGDLVETLSGGQRRRVEIAKGLLHRPSVLLMDEPSTGLDPGARLEMWRLLEEIRAADGVTVLLTTHGMDEAERCARVAILDAGRLVACDAPGRLREEVGGSVVLLESDDAAALRSVLKERWGAEGAVLAGQVRLERPDGAAFAARALAELSDRVRSVQIRKPSLEDVFLRRAGRPFWEDSRG